MVNFAKGANTITKFVNKIMFLIAGVSVVIIAVSCTLSVINRFFLKGALVGTEEFTRMFFVWSTFFGVGTCISTGSLATVSIFYDKLPNKSKDVQFIICQLLGIILGFVMLRYGMEFTITTKDAFFGSSRMSALYVYIAIVFGGFNVILNSLNNMIQRLSNFGHGADVADVKEDEVD